MRAHLRSLSLFAQLISSDQASRIDPRLESISSTDLVRAHLDSALEIDVTMRFTGLGRNTPMRHVLHEYNPVGAGTLRTDGDGRHSVRLVLAGRRTCAGHSRREFWCAILHNHARMRLNPIVDSIFDSQVDLLRDESSRRGANPRTAPLDAHQCGRRWPGRQQASRIRADRRDAGGSLPRGRGPGRPCVFRRFRVSFPPVSMKAAGPVRRGRAGRRRCPGRRGSPV